MDYNTRKILKIILGITSIFFSFIVLFQIYTVRFPSPNIVPANISIHSGLSVFLAFALGGAIMLYTSKENQGIGSSICVVFFLISSLATRIMCVSSPDLGLWVKTLFSWSLLNGLMRVATEKAYNHRALNVVESLFIEDPPLSPEEKRQKEFDQKLEFKLLIIFIVLCYSATFVINFIVNHR